MNLLKASRGMTNPLVPVQTILWMRSTGYTTDASGHRTPVLEQKWVKAQVQSLTTKEIQHSDMLNLQGVQRVVYLLDPASGTIRADKKGGDVLRFPEHYSGTDQDWLVTEVAERWDQWTKVLVTMQVAI